MPTELITCRRSIAAPAAQVWAVIQDFDLGWHPFVSICHLRRDARGAILRDFETTDGGHLVEQRTYISATDRVLCYTALSGIEGALHYTAQVTVAEGDGSCDVTWQATITAPAERCSAIAQGTRAVFDAGLDYLAKDHGAIRAAKLPVLPDSPVTPDQIDGVPRLSYLSGGAPPAQGAPLIVLLHGIGGQASNWEPQITALGHGFRMAALNLRGYGDSTLGFGPTQIDDHCGDILTLAARFGADKLVLVGLSMGAWIATSFAMRHGDRLAGLVLAGGCTGMSEAAPADRDRFRASREAPLAQGQTPADFAPAVVDIIAGPTASDTVRDRLHASMAAIPAQTYGDALACFCAPTERFDFTKIACPVMLLTGAYDVLAPPAEIRQVSTRIRDAAPRHTAPPDVQFDVIADAGHLCNLEQPEAFNAHLRRFLSRLPRVGLHDKPTRAEKQHRKRERILQAAHAAFCEVGFDGVSMDHLAKAADVSKPTLYQYFGDKEGLFAAVLDAGRAHITAPLAGSDGSLVDRLWRFSWTYAEFVLRPDMLSLARLILGEAGRHPASAIRYHASGPARAFEGLVDFVTTAQAEGALTAADPRLVANDLWSLILSGPRDYYLHHVAQRPTQTELLTVIGHGLGVFLTAYSSNPAQDRAALATRIADKTRTLGE